MAPLVEVPAPMFPSASIVIIPIVSWLCSSNKLFLVSSTFQNSLMVFSVFGQYGPQLFSGFGRTFYVYILSIRTLHVEGELPANFIQSSL